VARAVERLRAGGDVRFAEGPHALVPGPERRERVEALRRDVAGWVEDALADFDEAGFDPEALRPALEGQAARLEADPELEPTELDTLQVEWRGERWWKTSLYASGALSDRTYREALRGAVDEAFDVRHEVVDPYGIADELGPLLATDLLRALVVCGVLVVVFVLLWMGDVALGLVALVPVAAGLGISLGGLAFLGVPLHPGNFVAVPLILGLGVDDGIHLALRHREGGSTGVTLHAIWRTSATTALGFGSLVTAQSPALASLGGIVLAGVLVCFAASALVLPPLLRRR
jgi:uncharacterized membrane protein YdfJ with MMPL/SSD domain